ncbi:MAG: ABC transporter ATP-binding protein [Oscillospiraceae bacterium]|jgi:ABC-type multidrug transport system ATPase subunit|nr:ABC transporter ATP-binding protein [Oscillospiraceae bacterium]
MKISDIKKSYGKFTVQIKELEIPHGYIYGIIGPNGSGKTTAMKLMAGVTSPDCGNIDYEGLNIRDITMVLKKPYLLHDTVIKNLLYPLKLRKITPDTDLVDHYLEIAGLQNRRNEYALGLSGGEQQKLSLIRALIFSPKLIFIDESFSNMDIESVAFFESYILNMQKTQPKTWIIISHQLSNIKRLCEYVYFMHNGEIKVSGLAENILSNPENIELQKYLQYS